MIETFESTAKAYPDRVFLTFVDDEGRESAFSYRQTRLIAVAMARRLRDKGVGRGDCVSVDLANCPEYVFLALAAGYGSFSLVCLNHRLTASEKFARLSDLESQGMRIALKIDHARANNLMNYAESVFEMGSARAESVDDGLGIPSDFSPELAYVGAAVPRRVPGSDVQMAMPRRVATRSRGGAPVRSSRTRVGRSGGYVYGGASSSARGGRTQRAYGSAAATSDGASGNGRAHSIMGVQRDAFEDTVHFAEREAHLFDADTCAIIMFTSGTTGRAKAVPLSWSKLEGAAAASNRILSRRGAGLWQAVLPFYHIGGFQVLVRSVLNRTPLRLYAKFDADRVLQDAVEHEVTHISVVDKMLRDMLACNEAAALARYSCVLLGGAALNPTTVEDCIAGDVPLYASYGMTETSSQIANARANAAFDGGLKLLPGYTARIVDPDEDGFGRLAVRGPGVFDGYINARAAFTVDGYFLTGDTAALQDDKLYVRERTDDMFVSGGENVYPAEIAKALMRIPGVGDAYVFGDEDPQWGRRPVAFVERKKTDAAAGLTAREIRRALASRLSKLYLPKHLFVVDEMPRTGIGKTDRARIEELYRNRLQVDRIVLYHVRLPFKHPFKTARATLSHRDLLIVEAIDREGRVGLGECSSFTTDWYLPETLGEDAKVIQQVLIPYVKGRAFLHPREVSQAFDAIPEAASHPMACSAIEMALWDLYAKTVERPLWQVMGDEYDLLRQEIAGKPAAAVRRVSASAEVRGSEARTPSGAVVGVGTTEDTLAQISNCLEAGYRRIKLKVTPDTALSVVRDVRKAFPDIMLTLDANQSFLPHECNGLLAYDELNIGWIEEPLAFAEYETSDDAFARLAALQRHMATPVCVDESVTNAEEAARMLSYPELRLVTVKFGKFGGIRKTLEFIVRAQASGRDVWVGGMYDTGISRRVSAAFQTLPGLIFPGDIGGTGRYFATDVTRPRYGVDNGMIVLNPEGYETGIGCELDHDALAGVLMQRVTFE